MHKESLHTAHHERHAQNTCLYIFRFSNKHTESPGKELQMGNLVKNVLKTFKH